jgi:hypothetical protein
MKLFSQTDRQVDRPARLIVIKVSDLGGVMQRGVATDVLLVDDPSDVIPDGLRRIRKDCVQTSLVFVVSVGNVGHVIRQRFPQDRVKDGASVGQINDGESCGRNCRI